MSDREIEDLLSRYVDGLATEKEVQIIDHWYANLALNEDLLMLTGDPNAIKSSIWKKIHKRSTRFIYRYAAAAALIIGVGIGSYTFLHKNRIQQNTIAVKQDISPGGNKAILTLANGKKIILNTIHKGVIATQEQALISKTDDGKVVYESQQGARGKENLYNTMSTPRGGNYQLTLSDGTSVYLDAASSIRYPVRFTGAFRDVEITGQVYFEVAHNSAQPFHVTSKGQKIEVLGTHFNVNAYEDESVTKTTLIEGSVRVVAAGNQSVKILPGEQVVLKHNHFKIDTVDVEAVVAWKNGQFLFNDDTLGEIMRKISRWYDVEVVYTDGIDPETQFGGGVSRYDKVSKVLKKLEKTGGIHFRIEGRRIFIGK